MYNTRFNRTLLGTRALIRVSLFFFLSPQRYFPSLQFHANPGCRRGNRSASTRSAESSLQTVSLLVHSAQRAICNSPFSRKNEWSFVFHRRNEIPRSWPERIPPETQHLNYRHSVKCFRRYLKRISDAARHFSLTKLH